MKKVFGCFILLLISFFPIAVKANQEDVNLLIDDLKQTNIKLEKQIDFLKKDVNYSLLEIFGIIFENNSSLISTGTLTIDIEKKVYSFNIYSIEIPDILTSEIVFENIENNLIAIINQTNYAVQQLNTNYANYLFDKIQSFTINKENIAAIHNQFNNLILDNQYLDILLKLDFFWPLIEKADFNDLNSEDTINYLDAVYLQYPLLSNQEAIDLGKIINSFLKSHSDIYEVGILINQIQDYLGLLTEDNQDLLKTINNDILDIIDIDNDIFSNIINLYKNELLFKGDVTIDNIKINRDKYTMLSNQLAHLKNKYQEIYSLFKKDTYSFDEINTLLISVNQYLTELEIIRDYDNPNVIIDLDNKEILIKGVMGISEFKNKIEGMNDFSFVFLNEDNHIIQDQEMVTLKYLQTDIMDLIINVYEFSKDTSIEGIKVNGIETKLIDNLYYLKTSDKEINIDVYGNHSKAIVNGIGYKKISNGKNYFQILVVSEDGSSQVYSLLVEKPYVNYKKVIKEKTIIINPVIKEEEKVPEIVPDEDIIIPEIEDSTEEYEINGSIIFCIVVIWVMFVLRILVIIVEKIKRKETISSTVQITKLNVSEIVENKKNSSKKT